jgi:hypothetical protein
MVIFVGIWIGLPLDLLPVRAEEPLERNESIALGSGPISGGNLASAKKAAISRALERGVEQYLVRKLGSRVMTVGFQRVIREVLPGGEELVENFQVLAEEPTGDRYHVLVRMRINEEIMEETLRDAGLSKAEMVPAKVLFMVSETVGEDITHWWENPASHSSLAPTEVALYQAFQERGLAPINRTMSLPSGDLSGYAAVPELELDQIVAWGRLFSADMVLYGFSQIQQEDITLMLSAVDVQKGDIVGDSTRIIGLPSPATETQILESLEILADQMASKLAPVIREAAARSQGGLSELAVLLRGLTSYSQFRILQDFLSREVQGVQSVRQTRVRRDSISIAVEFQGNRDMFLNRVLNHERLPLPLRVEPSAEDQIVLVVESQVLPGRSPEGR